MASMAMVWFPLAITAAFNKEIDLLDDSIKLMFLSSAASPSQDTWDYKNDLTNEVTGTNLPAGGTALANDTITYTAGTNVWKYDADDLSIASVTASDLKYGILYDSTPGTDATRPLLALGTIDVAVSPAAGTLSITFDAAGILTATAS
jgi:hypothetical protein